MAGADGVRVRVSLLLFVWWLGGTNSLTRFARGPCVLCCSEPVVGVGVVMLLDGRRCKVTGSSFGGCRGGAGVVDGDLGGVGCL